MSGKRACLCALFGIFFGLGGAHAQDPKGATPAPAVPAEVLPQPGDSWPAPGGPSLVPPAAGGPLKWGAAGTCGESCCGDPGGFSCCGPVGGHGPIILEAYLRSGVSIPGDGELGDVVKTGWAVQGGARALYLGAGQNTSPWILDLSLSNYNYDGNDPNRVFTLRNVPVVSPQGTVVLPAVNVTVRGLNQTIVNAGVGRDWYLLGTTDCVEGEANWRVGFDAGGGWGSGKIDFDVIRQRTDVIGRFFAGIHSDLEFPCSWCVIQAGVRAEYSYTWSDLLPGNGDLEAYNLLLTLGTRY